MNQVAPGVLGQLPEAHAPQAPPPGQLRLGGDGVRVVIGEEGPVAVEVGDPRLLVPEPAVSALAEIVAFDLVPGDGLPGAEGLIQPVVPASNALVYVPIKRHAQHQLFRRDAPLQPGGDAAVHAGAVAGRAVRGGIEGGVEVRVRVPGPVEVIGHEKNMVHDFRHSYGLDAVEVAAAHRPGHGEDIPLPVPPPLPVQGLPEVPQQRGEVLTVLGPVDHAGGPAGDGVLPVQVHAVQAVGGNQVRAALGEDPPASGGGRRVGEPGGPVPPAQGEDDFQPGVLLPQGPQPPEVPPVPDRVGQHGPALLNPGEGVVDLGEPFRRNVLRHISLPGGPGGVVAHHLPAAPRGGDPSRQRQRQGENQGQQNKTARLPHASKLLYQFIRYSIKLISTISAFHSTAAAPAGARNRFWKSREKIKRDGANAPSRESYQKTTFIKQSKKKGAANHQGFSIPPQRTVLRRVPIC